MSATPSRWLRGLGWVVAVGFGLVAVALLLLSLVTVVHTWHPWLIAAATFIPFLWVPTLLCLLGLVLALTHWRRWVALGVVEALETPFDNIVVRTTVGETEWLVAGIHAAPPQLGADAWARDGELVADLVERHLDERMLLVGDFNAIDQHHTMRRIVDAGAVNTAATRYGGETWNPTWPVGHPWLPTFARIDHYLMTPAVNGWAPTYFEVDGSDHVGLVATAPKPLA